MIKLKDLLVERIDYLDTAESLAKKYKLRSKVKITSGKDKADYDVDRDIINIRPSYSNIKDFLISVLHEIDHAKDAYKLGKSKYKFDYSVKGEMAQQKGGDFHDDNPYEEKAENWAKKEYKKWINKF